MSVLIQVLSTVRIKVNGNNNIIYYNYFNYYTGNIHALRWTYKLLRVKHKNENLIKQFKKLLDFVTKVR